MAVTVSAVFVLAMCAMVLSCGPSTEVVAFADEARQVFEAGSFIFDDLPESCVRRHAAAEPIRALYLPLKPATATSPDATCERFSAEARALRQQSSLLVTYFTAMKQLAAFNTMNLSTPVETAAQSSSEGELGKAQAEAAGKLSGIVTQAIAGHYQRRKIAHYVQEADPSIAVITNNFEKIAGDDYERLLREEQQTLTARYQEVGETGSLAVIVLLNRAYSDDVNAVKQRKVMAEAYAKALETIREGHAKLAEGSRHEEGKALQPALQGYISKLEELLPAMRQRP